MSHVAFGPADPTTFCSLDSLGLTVAGQYIDARRAVLESRAQRSDDRCRWCGLRGRSLVTHSRRLAHEPFGGRPAVLLERVRRYWCDACSCYWAEILRDAAQMRAKISHRGLAWALKALVVDHLSMSRITAGLGVACHTANDAADVSPGWLSPSIALRPEDWNPDG